MEYNGKKFEAIIATPGAGKSFLCDRSPAFVDADEIKLRLKYHVPYTVTRAELEKTKGERHFEKNRDYTFDRLYKALDMARRAGKIIIAPPNPEFWDYMQSRNIPFCFVYQAHNTRDELVKRYRERNNPESTVQEFAGEKQFESHYKRNLQENRATVKYQFSANEYLADILIKFGCKF